MSNVVDDGFNSYDGDENRTSLIKGTKIKFSKEAQWIAGDDTVIEADREFLVVELIKHAQKWVGDRPAETLILGATEKFPDIEKLNNEAPREEWREKFGKEVGPWEIGYTVYLIDPETWEIYSYPTSTIGGGQAVRDLRAAVYMARRIQGPGIYPRVRLTDIFMKTKFEGRQRPRFEIIAYEKLHSEQAALTADQPKLIESKSEAESPKPAALAKPPAKRPPASKPRKVDPDFDNAA